MSDSYKAVSVLVANINKNKNCDLSYRQRENEIVNLFKELSTKPEICLLQEAYIWKNSRNNQIRDVIEALNTNGNWTWFRRREYSSDHFNKFNAIFCNESGGRITWKGPVYLGDLLQRFCAYRLNIEGETVLVVSFHGFYKKPVYDRKCYLERFINFFCEERRLSGSSHLIIGGDFNIDLDEFGQGHDQFLQEKNLKIVPYQNQRNGGKIDGLICDVDIDVNGVTVFADKVSEEKTGENTEVVRTNLSRHTLDHQPILFQLGLPVR
jgi:hypothetical protein